MKTFISYVAVLVLGFLICLGVMFKVYGPPSDGNRGAIAPNIPRVSPLVARAGSDDIRRAADIVSKYVVNIDTVGRPIRQTGPGEIFGFPFGQPQEVIPKGQASGVIYSSDGYIITNNHVVQDAEKLTVTLQGGKQYAAKLIGRDPKTDIAVIKIDARNLPYAKFAPTEPRVGDWVIAVGSPLGLQSTVTVGVVSATKRGPINIDGVVLEQAIQTDAAINPGNSGGALADINGALVGINTAIKSVTGGSVGIGFAIPDQAARRIAEQLIKHGKVRRPYLGISYGSYNKRVREQLAQRGLSNLPKQDGAIIADVLQGSPAASAGLEPMDIILRINDQPVTGGTEEVKGKIAVSDAIGKAKIGSRLLMTVWRARTGKIVEMAVIVQEAPADFGGPR